MGERASQDESGRCGEQTAAGWLHLGTSVCNLACAIGKNWGGFLRRLVYSVASETIQDTHSPRRWMSELQASDKPVPRSLCALTTGKKNSFVKLSQVWSQASGLAPPQPSSLQTPTGRPAWCSEWNEVWCLKCEERMCKPWRGQSAAGILAW